MKKILVLLFLVTAVAVPAQTLISNFSNSSGFVGLGTWNPGGDNFTFNSGILTIGPVSIGNTDNTGYFIAPIAGGGSFNATGLTLLSVTARLDSGNFAPGFIINLYDSLGNGALTATFSASNFNSSFTTGSTLVSVYPAGGGLITDIKSFGIAGTGTTVAFRISFDNITLAAVPEPATYAALAGIVALGFAVWRRRVVRTS